MLRFVAILTVRLLLDSNHLHSLPGESFENRLVDKCRADAVARIHHAGVSLKQVVRLTGTSEKTIV
ncbi:MAG: hypothetical protein GX123_02300 [Clostridiales bacterium]|nr:hypothetical protein [Clostridiales bacterium]